MPTSRLFASDRFKSLEASIVQLLNNEPYFLTTVTHASTRAAGDAIQSIVGARLGDLLGDLVTDYTSAFARRAMADIAFGDVDGNFYVVDVKTHRLGTAFNMPNLTSVERLTRFYEDDKNYFVLLLVKYRASEDQVVVEDVTCVPIEFLSWECLTVGALGWGQIQIANANKVVVAENYPRKRWMLELCEVMLSFYPREIAKIGDRITYFEEVRDRWLSRSDA